MTIKELLQKISSQVVKQAPQGAEAAKTAKFVEKVNATFSKENVGKIAGKIAGAAAAANVTDSLIKDVPVANNIYTWYATVIDDIYENTTRKIPVVGDFLRKVSDTINKLVIPNAQRAIEQHRVNKPSFYTNLGTHIEFGIPLVYPDVVGVPFLGGLNYASIGFVKLGFNPLTSYSKIKSRFTQLLDLLKGVRGLSGQLPYSEGDLFFYDWNTKYLLTEYFRLKYALKMSHVYNLTKNALPKQVLDKLGFNPDDFIANKAQYKQVLTNMHEQITVTVPMFGQLSERIQDLLYKLIPDSDDPKVALYYCVMLYIDTLVPNSADNNYYHFTSHFHLVEYFDHTRNYISFATGAVTGITYASYLANYLGYIDMFPTAFRSFSSIKGDLVGAFGPAVFWKDAALKDVESVNPDDMYHSFDELFLTQLQNGTLTDMLGSDYRPSGSIEQAFKYGDGLVNFTLPQITSGALSDMMRPANTADDFAEYQVTFNGANPEGTAGIIYLPSTDGMRRITSLYHNLEDSTGVIANKSKLSEGESYEILQLTAMVTKKDAGYDAQANADWLNLHFRTNTFYIERFDILYYDVNAHQNAEARIRPTNVVMGGTTTHQYNILDNLLTTAQFWSQADYGIKLPIRIEDSSRMKDYMLLDFNIMGSISRSAFTVVVTNSAYSLYYANIKVGNNTGKRTGNIVQAYSQVK